MNSATLVQKQLSCCDGRRLQPDRVRRVLPMIRLIPRPLVEELRVRLSQLDETGVQAVVTARLEGSVTNGRLQEITGAHPKDITAILQALVRDGLLEQQNQRRWASYRLAGDSPQTELNSPQSVVQTGSDSPQTAPDSPQSSVQTGLDSPQTAPNSPQSSVQTGSDSPQTSAALPDALKALSPIAEPARTRKWIPAHEMRKVIEEQCRDRWLSSAELALLLDRDAEKLQSRFLTAMVREGRLELRYPDVPNRPDQTYRAVAPST